MFLRSLIMHSLGRELLMKLKNVTLGVPTVISGKQPNNLAGGKFNQVPSSSGLGRRLFMPKIAGSTPAGTARKKEDNVHSLSSKGNREFSSAASASFSFSITILT